MIKLYYADISGIDDGCVNGLSDYRLQNLSSMKYKPGRKQGIGAELLLNEAVRENFPHIPLPLDIKTSSCGKPYCEDLPFYFSLSHSGSYSACAVSEYEIGLDIQKISPFNEKLARRCFTPEELEQIYSSDNCDLEFTRIWAVKESVLKALGFGLKLPMSSFSIYPGQSGIRLGSDFLSFSCDLIEDFCCSVCIRNHDISGPEIKNIQL